MSCPSTRVPCTMVLLLCVLCYVLVIMYDIMPYNGNQSYRNGYKYMTAPAIKQILLYNSFCGDKTWSLLGNTFDKCPVSNCHITNDASALETSDVILFHIPNLRERRFPDYERPSNQRWVFFMLESEAYMYIHKGNMAYASHPWKSAFNWTMTYRPDSDITMYYGEIEEREDIFPKNHLSIAKSKTKSVAWLVSHCDTASKREQYVAELAKHIPVNIW